MTRVEVEIKSSCGLLEKCPREVRDRIFEEVVTLSPDPEVTKTIEGLKKRFVSTRSISYELFNSGNLVHLGECLLSLMSLAELFCTLDLHLR
jgi:hypothetical protein